LCGCAFPAGETVAGREKEEKEKQYMRKSRQARIDSAMEITYDRVKTESQH